MTLYVHLDKILIELSIGAYGASLDSYPHFVCSFAFAKQASTLQGLASRLTV